MRALHALASAALACTTLACRNGTGVAPGDASVYVPPGSGGDTDGSTQAEAGGLALGQVDRAGRPLVALLLVPDSLRDDYNAVSTFDAPLPRLFQDGLASRLHALDTIALGDGGPDPVDWTIDAGPHPLVPVFATDVLLVDTALSCTLPDGGFAASYLDIEREIFGDVFLDDGGHTTCGGRTPSDNVVDTTLALLITRNRQGAPPVTEGVTGPTKPATAQFPYLAGPNTN
jgi:uncharacterized protein DUF4331